LLAPQHYTSSVKGFRDKIDLAKSTLIDLIALREDRGCLSPGGNNRSAAGPFCGEALRAIA
jgi:hypothetical protein